MHALPNAWARHATSHAAAARPLLPFAGATLLAPRLALTAAFCVNPPGGVLRPELVCGLWQLENQQPGTYDVLSAARVIT